MIMRQQKQKQCGATYISLKYYENRSLKIWKVQKRDHFYYIIS